jgi:hypothetical protein
MTAEASAAWGLKRAVDTTKMIDAKDLTDQGYSKADILSYMLAVTMAQVKKDIVPLTIAETVALTGADINGVTEFVENYLKETVK